MGCGEATAEEKLLLTKLERLEIQVMKQKELNKLSKLEGKDIKDLDKFNSVNLDMQNEDKKSPLKKSKKKGVKKKIVGTKKKIKWSKESKE